MTTEGGGPSSAPVLPDYASDSPRLEIRRWYWLALIFGAAPLIGGVSILFAYIVTANQDLPVLGLLALFVGLFCFASGFGCLTEYQHRAAHAIHPRQLRRQLAMAHMLLWSNLLAAVACAFFGIRVMESRMHEFF